MIQLLGKNGSGKSYIANCLFDLGYEKNVGYTTRDKRPGEIDGLDYHFIIEKEFEELLKQGFFAEYKKRYGNYYGISFEELGDNVVIVGGNKEIIETTTNKQVDTFYVEASLEKRIQRMLKRGDKIEDIVKRIHDENFSYLYDFETIIIDNEKENGVSNLLSILYSNREYADKEKIEYSKYINRQLEIFEFGKKYEGIKTILECEEYILRNIWMSNYDSEKQYKVYLKEMKKILEYYDNNYIVSEDFFDIIEENKVYRLDYKKSRIGRR